LRRSKNVAMNMVDGAIWAIYGHSLDVNVTYPQVTPLEISWNCTALYGFNTAHGITSNGPALRSYD